MAHLATATRDGRPAVVPVCFVYSGNLIYSTIDEKPKTTTRLLRIRNIAENPYVSFIVDEYSENWRRLRYVILAGTAKVLTRGREHRAAIQSLRRKYRQYRTMRLEERQIIRIKPIRTVVWRSISEKA